MSPGETTYRCSASPCDRIKGSNNHWFVILTFSKKRGREFLVLDFNDQTKKLREARFACSESCLHKMLSRWSSSETTSAKPETLAGATEP